MTEVDRKVINRQAVNKHAIRNTKDQNKIDINIQDKKNLGIKRMFPS